MEVEIGAYWLVFSKFILIFMSIFHDHFYILLEISSFCTISEL